MVDNKKVEDMVQTLINGGVVWRYTEDEEKEIRKRLIEIKNNATDVLSQMADNRRAKRLKK